MLLVALAAGIVGGLLRLRYDTSVATFLPSGDSARQAYALDEEKFGSDPITVLIRSREGKPLITTGLLPELIRTEGQLAKLPGSKVVYGPGTIINQLAAAAQNVLTDITFKRQEIARQAEATARSHGASASAIAKAQSQALERFDLRYGTLLTRALPAGLPTLSNQSFIQAIAFDQNEPRPTLRFVIPDDHSVVIAVRPVSNLDQGQVKRLVDQVDGIVRRAKLGKVDARVTGSPVVLASLVDQSRRELPRLTLLSVAAVSGLLLLGAWRLRGRQRLISTSLPLAAAGVAVLTDLAVLGWMRSPVSLVLIAVLPALIGIGSDVPIYLDRFGATRQVVATAVATAAGFAVAGLSPVPFIAQLGWLLAAGVLVAAVVAQLLRLVLATQPVSGTSEITSRGPGVGMRTARRLLVALSVVALIGWVRLPDIPLKADLAGLAGGLHVQDDATYSSRALGASGQLDVLLTGGAKTSDALAWTARARDVIITRFGNELRPILSLSQLLTFLGPTPTPQQIQSGLALLPDYLVRGVLTEDGGTFQLSFAIVPSDVDQQRRLIDQLQRALPAAPPSSRTEIAGVPAAAAQELRLLDESRLESNVLGIVAPSAVLLLVLGWRRRDSAGRALLAAGVATGVALFSLELTGASLTPLTLALGSLTAAVGCEFSLMLQHRGGLAWRSVLIAGATSAAGYLVLSASQLIVMRNFSLVLASSVVWAGLAAYLVALAFPRPDETLSTRKRQRVDAALEAVPVSGSLLVVDPR